MNIFVAGEAFGFLPAVMSVYQDRRLPPRARRSYRIDGIVVVVIGAVVIVGAVVIIGRIIIGRLGAGIVIIVIPATEGED